MIEFLRHHKGGIDALDKPVPKSWMNVIKPDEKELAWLKSVIPLTDDMLDSLRDADQIPLIDEHKDFTFIIIRTPLRGKGPSPKYTTVSLGVFSTKDFVVTICFYESDVINWLKKHKFPFRKTQLTFRLLLESAKLYLEYLKDIKEQMYVLESDLGKTLQNESVLGLLEIEKMLVYFETSLKGNSVVLDRLANGKTLNKFIVVKNMDDRRLINSVIDENKQAIQTVNIYSDILGSTLDAFASIISNNLNNVIKVLTSMTIILTVPVLIASIYGMNVELPFQRSPNAFLIVMVFSLLLSFIFVFVFWKKKML